MQRRRWLLLDHGQRNCLWLAVFIIGVIAVVHALRPYNFIPQAPATPVEAVSSAVAPAIGPGRSHSASVSDDWSRVSVSFSVDGIGEPAAVRDYVLSVVAKSAPTVVDSLPGVETVGYQAYRQMRDPSGRACRLTVAVISLRKQTIGLIDRDHISPERLPSVADSIEWSDDLQP